jgi:hypothetical protein
MKNQVTIPPINIDYLFSFETMTPSDLFNLFYFIKKKNILSINNMKNDNIEVELLKHWNIKYKPSQELMTIITEKFKLTEGQINMGFWKVNIIELIHDELLLGILTTETTLSLLKDCFEDKGAEFQMIFISNWMIARKRQGFVFRNLFEVILQVS